MLTNPASGHGSAPHAAERAIAQFHRRGVDVVAIAGSDAEHARRLVEGALERGMDALVVVGGDGIVSLALQVLAQTDIPLGIIPAGTGNDHAREFGIPTKRSRGRRRRRRRRGDRESTWAGSPAPTAPTAGSAP